MARSIKDGVKNTGQMGHVPGYTENEVMAAYHAYKGKNRAEMEEELFRVAQKEMEDGTFDPAQMDDFLKAVSPMLTAEQRGRMAELITLVKARAK